MSRSKIIGCGSYLPKQVLSNEELAKRFSIDTSDDWIIARTGIKQRHIAELEEYTSDLGANALIEALRASHLEKEDLDGIILATSTADIVFPATANVIAKKVGIKHNCFCFDINVTCAGFLYALAVGDSLLKNKAAKRIAIIGAETMSKIVDWNDRSTCVLFGDGAGVIILESTTELDSGILGFQLASNNSLVDILKVEGGTSRGNHDAKIYMNGREVYRYAVENMYNSSKMLLDLLSVKVQEIDWFIAHQANLRILNAVTEKLGIEQNKVVATVSHHANTSAASIPLAFAEHFKNVKSQDLILFSAIGAGISWGSLLLRV